MNAVCPGTVETPSWHVSSHDDTGGDDDDDDDGNNDDDNDDYIHLVLDIGVVA